MNFKGYDLALITDEKQRQYFLGFHSTAGYVMLTPKGTTFVVDSRYISAAKKALEQFKMEAASEVGVNLNQGYNGDLTARQAGSIGGQMVKKMVESYENKMQTK